jgi:hypothetical protein
MSDLPKPAGTPQAGAPGGTIHEVRGIFPSDAALQEAIAQLTLAGFDRADLSLPHATPWPEDATPEQGADEPTTEVDAQQARTLHTSGAAAVGALLAAGVTVATGGVAAAAAGAAVGAGAAAGAVAAALSRGDDSSQHEKREKAAAAGELILSVRTPNAAKEGEAEAIMRAAKATRVDTVVRETAVPPPRG